MCALQQWGSMPWVDREPSPTEVSRMRWVCRRCPVLAECSGEVDRQLATGVVVAGFRAGESARARTYRLRRSQNVRVVQGAEK